MARFGNANNILSACYPSLSAVLVTLWIYLQCNERENWEEPHSYAQYIMIVWNVDMFGLNAQNEKYADKRYQPIKCCNEQIHTKPITIVLSTNRANQLIYRWIILYYYFNLCIDDKLLAKWALHRAIMFPFSFLANLLASPGCASSPNKWMIFNEDEHEKTTTTVLADKWGFDWHVRRARTKTTAPILICWVLCRFDANV